MAKRVRRTDEIFHAESCHEPDGINHGLEWVAFIGMKLGSPSESTVLAVGDSVAHTRPSIATTGISPTVPKASSLRWPGTTILAYMGKVTIAITGSDRRTGAFPKSFQCTVWYDDAFCDTFRERSESRTAHDANLRVTEVRGKELRKFHDVFRG